MATDYLLVACPVGICSVPAFLRFVLGGNMARSIRVKTIKASNDGQPRIILSQGENKIRMKIKQAQTLAAAINRKYGKSLAF
jgi:hypothetical protein